MHDSNTKNKNKPSSTGKDSRSGQFVPIEKSRRSPDGYISEHVPKSGRGDMGVKPGRRPPGNNKPRRR